MFPRLAAEASTKASASAKCGGYGGVFQILERIQQYELYLKLCRTRVAQKSESRQIKFLDVPAQKSYYSAMPRNMRTLIRADQVSTRQLGDQLHRRSKSRIRHVLLRDQTSDHMVFSKVSKCFPNSPADGKRFADGGRQGSETELRVTPNFTYSRAHRVS